MQKVIIYLSISLLTLFCLSCNSDIFVEPVPDLEEDTYYLDCGASASFTIPTKGLRNVRFESEDYYADYVEYLNKDGAYVDDPTLDNVARVKFYSPYFCIDFQIDGEHIKATALDNTTSAAKEVYVELEYEHTSRYIYIVISPGTKLEISHLGYDIVRPVSGIYTERGIPHSYVNNSDQSVRIGIYPFKEAKSSVKFTLDESDNWAFGVKGMARIPFFAHGEWQDSDSNRAEVTIGGVTSFYSPDLDIEEEYVIEVPPHSKVTTVTEITYATLEVSYMADIKQSGSGLTFWASGYCRLMQPISYKIEQR